MNINNQEQANAYVLAGISKEERIKRLAELPEDVQKKAEFHVRTVFSVRKHHKNNS